MSLLKNRRSPAAKSAELVLSQPGSARAAMAYAKQRVFVDYLVANRTRQNLENIAMVYNVAISLAQAVPEAEGALKAVTEAYALGVIGETQKGL